MNNIMGRFSAKVLPEVLTALKEADLIIFSMGSLYTSVLPNVMCKEVKAVLKEAKAPIMYLCNVVTQPGETDDFTVSDHVKLLNRYLDKKKVDAVIASNTKLDKEIAKKYETEEQKEPVKIDYEKLSTLIFVPATAGLLCASYIINDIVGDLNV